MVRAAHGSPRRLRSEEDVGEEFGEVDGVCGGADLDLGPAGEAVGEDPGVGSAARTAGQRPSSAAPVEISWCPGASERNTAVQLGSKPMIGTPWRSRGASARAVRASTRSAVLSWPATPRRTAPPHRPGHPGHPEATWKATSPRPRIHARPRRRSVEPWSAATGIGR